MNVLLLAGLPRVVCPPYLRSPRSMGDEIVGEPSTQRAPPLFVDPVLACPATLGELTEGFRSYGGALGVVRYKASPRRPGVRVSVGMLCPPNVNNGCTVHG